MTRLPRGLVAAGALAAAGAAPPAHAQSAEAAPKPPSWAVDEIVVTGRRATDYAEPLATVSRTPVPLIDTPQSIQVLNRTLIDEQQLTTLADALQNTSGTVPAQPSEAVLADPIIRGFQAQIFVDGLLSYADTAVADPSSLAGVERIEVAKGPTSLLYGGGTGAPVGGLINLVSKAPSDQPSYAFAFRAGSFGTVQPSLDVNQPVTDWLSVRLPAEYVRSDDAIRHVGLDRITLSPSARLKLGPATELLLRFGYNRITQLEYAGLPAAIARAPGVDPFHFSGASDAPRTAIENRTLDAVLDHRFSDAISAKLQVRRYASDFDEHASFPYFAFFPLQGTRAPIIKGRLPIGVREWTVDASLTAKAATGPVDHVLLVGATYDATDYDGAIGFTFAPIGVLDYADPRSDLSYGADPTTSPIVNRYRTTAIYAQDQASFGPVHLLGGLRWSRMTLKEVTGGQGTDRNYDEVDPRIGATVDVARGVSLFAGYAAGSRLVLFFNGAGTPPKPETSQSYEAGLKFGGLAYLTGTIAAYQITRQNVATASPTVPFAQVQTGEQRSRGVETDLVWEPSRSLSVLATYAYTDAAVTRDTTIPIGDALPRVPRHSGRVAVRYRFLDGPLRGLGVGAGVTAASAAELTLPNSYRSDSYATLDAQASYETGRYRLALSVINLADNRYFLPYQYLQQAVVRPGAPRSAYVTLGVKF